MDGPLARPRLPPDDPVLPRIAEALRAHFAERLVRLVLHGSRARGDHGPGSDYDLAVFVTGEVDRMAEIDRAIPLAWDIEDRLGVHVDIHVFPEADQGRQTLFMHFVRTEGIEL